MTKFELMQTIAVIMVFEGLAQIAIGFVLYALGQPVK